jgi:Mor family transcriptional regulator
MTDEAINNGKGTQPETERNEALAKDYQAGMSLYDLMIKYKVTDTRIYAILRQLGISPNRKVVKTSRRKMGGAR